MELCQWTREGDVYTCGACGFAVTLAGDVGTAVPAAVCGKPSTLRVYAGETSGGPGTRLKGLLAAVGIVAGPKCRCGERAAAMDALGVAWCEQNVEEIVGWLEEEAKQRGIRLFTRVGARMLVKKAIRRAHKDASRGSGPPLSNEREAVAVEVYAPPRGGGRLDVHERPEKSERQGKNPD